MIWQNYLIYTLTVLSLIGALGTIFMTNVRHSIQFGLRLRGYFLLLSFIMMNILIIIVFVEGIKNKLITNQIDNVIAVIGIVLASIGYIWQSIKYMSAR